MVRIELAADSETSRISGEIGDRQWLMSGTVMRSNP